MRILNEVNPPLEDALAHFGVKGMRWGQRKAQESTGGGTRKATRAEKRAHQEKFNQEKGDRLIKTAQKDPEVLIKLKTQDPYPVIVTGKEFIQHLSNGGVMDIRASDVYAKLDKKEGGYVQQAPQKYEKLKRVQT